MKKLLCRIGVVTLALGALAVQDAAAQTVTLRYAHMNAPSSIAGQQAAMLAKAIEEKTKGNLTEEESTMLSGAVYELRTRYIQLSSAARSV